jgi:hypothetical protein
MNLDKIRLTGWKSYAAPTGAVSCRGGVICRSLVAEARPRAVMRREPRLLYFPAYAPSNSKTRDGKQGVQVGSATLEGKTLTPTGQVAG